MTFVKWYLFKLKVSGYSFLYSVLSLADLINPLWKCQGRNEHKGMIMEYEHQPSGVRQPGQDTDATKRQECAKWCANQFRRYYLKVQETIRYRCVIPYAGISFNFLVLPIHRYQYYLFQEPRIAALQVNLKEAYCHELAISLEMMLYHDDEPLTFDLVWQKGSWHRTMPQ